MTYHRNDPRKALFVHSAQIESYHYPAENPFRPERAGMTRGILASLGLLSPEDMLSPTPATEAELQAFHTPRYLQTLRRAERGDLDVEGLHMGLGSAECPVFIGMYDYAALACGGTLAGARAILDGRASVAFNPSGGYHHARPERAAGFCYLNDVVLACQLLAGAGKRVLFLDIDVHHDDGVQEAFYRRPDVLTMSFHETGRTLFPGTGSEDEIGEGPGAGYCVNVPLPPGTRDEEYLKAFRAVGAPILSAFDPDVIVFEVGMDTLAGDPLAHLDLTNHAPAEVAGIVMGMGKSVLAVGGGGYHPRNTARGWALIWTILSGQGAEDASCCGLGGVMLESTEWLGGLRDRALPHARPDEGLRRGIEETVEKVKANVFRYHGL
ncbi:MAG: acetoin utilization protein AcuC [Planctomycetota bacterium]|nr:acetoin utilization protein AcuC [Planctomycetota bacterium]